jgi:hypothetical protein
MNADDADSSDFRSKKGSDPSEGSDPFFIIGAKRFETAKRLGLFGLRAT